MTLSEYIDKTLPGLRETIKPSTYAMYEYRIKVLEPIIKVQLDDFNTNALQRIADILSQKFSKNSVSDNLVFIRMFLRKAMRDDLIPEKHFEKLRIRAVSRRRKHVVLTDDEFIKLSRFCTENPTRRGAVCCLAGLYAGLRIGEIAALKWDDIDMDACRLHVTRTRSRIYRYSVSTHPTLLIDGSPKSASSIRDIPIATPFITALEKLRKADRNAIYVATPVPSGSEPRQIREWMRSVITDAGVDPINPHGLRHSFITRAINNGANVKAVSELAGHSDTKITLDIYTHASDKSKTAAIAALE